MDDVIASSTKDVNTRGGGGGGGSTGGGGQGGGDGRPPNLSIGGAPTLGYNTKGCLRVHYCLYSVTVYTG